MNMKKIVAGITAFCLVAGAVPVSSVKFVDNSIVANAEDEVISSALGVITYRKYSDHIAIIKYESSDRFIPIPVEIYGLHVTEIGEYAFSNCSNLTYIDIPSSITKIGDHAFSGCSNLTEITIRNSNCEIYDSEDTIPNGTIYGDKDSTAQAYAEKYDKEFVPFYVKETTTANTSPNETTTITTTNHSVTLEYKSGDINDDNLIDASDASQILAIYSVQSTGGTPVESAEQLLSADVNGDGLTDASDASTILAYYAYVSTGGTNSIETFMANNG